MFPRRVSFLGMPLSVNCTIEDVCSLPGNSREKRFISFINPYSWAAASRHSKYLAALERMDMVLPDGFGVAVACRKLCGMMCERISFDMSSLAGPFFKTAEREGRSVMLVGGKPGVTGRVAAKLKKSYPALEISGTADGYKSFDALIAEIHARAPDITIVGMGAPRQELFLIALCDAGYNGFAITCGGFFDQYLEAKKYYPEWIDRNNLRFAWRLYKEPRRLWRRYLVDYQIFVWRVIKQALGFAGGIGLGVQKHPKKGVLHPEF